jgi:hypothetical protein
MFEKRLHLMQRRLRAWAEVTARLRDDMADAGIETRMVMITLTYRNVDDYRSGHMNTYMKAIKQSLSDGLLSFAWVAELQERGAVHYHLVVVVKRGTRIPMPDKSGMWPHGMSQVRTARTPFYLVKYTGKERQKDLGRFPRSCRLYAASVRPVEGGYRALFRVMSGLEKQASEGEGGGGSNWAFAGACVTRGYAEFLADGYVVK